MDMALVHCDTCMYCHVYLFVCMYTQMLPSKLEVVLPHDTTKATVKLWKVGGNMSCCTNNSIHKHNGHAGLPTAVSSQVPGHPSTIHEQVCVTDLIIY